SRQIGDPWQEPRDAAVRAEPEAHHRGAHARGRVGEAAVARECEREAGAHGRTIDRCDHRLLDVDDGLHELRERAGRRLLLIALERLLGEAGDAAIAAAGEPLGVTTGAEALAR